MWYNSNSNSLKKCTVCNNDASIFEMQTTLPANRFRLSIKLFAQSMHCCSCCGAAQGDMRHRLSEASEHFDLTNKHSKGLPQGTSIGGSDHIYTKHVIDNLDSDTIWYHMTPMILWEDTVSQQIERGQFKIIQQHLTLLSAQSEHNQAKRACTMSFCTGCISRQMFSPACLCLSNSSFNWYISVFAFHRGPMGSLYIHRSSHMFKFYLCICSRSRSRSGSNSNLRSVVYSSQNGLSQWDIQRMDNVKNMIT